MGRDGTRHDHAILLTGLDICSWKNEPCDTLGKTLPRSFEDGVWAVLPRGPRMLRNCPPGQIHGGGQGCQQRWASLDGLRSSVDVCVYSPKVTTSRGAVPRSRCTFKSPHLFHFKGCCLFSCSPPLCEKRVKRFKGVPFCGRSSTSVNVCRDVKAESHPSFSFAV